MSHPRSPAAAALLLCAAFGCAGGAASPFDPPEASARVYAVNEVEEPPVLQGCTRYTPPTVSPEHRLTVRVGFVVQRDGLVDPGSVTVISGTNVRPEAVNDAALEAARSCLFAPARLKGAAVAVRTSRSFSFAY